MSAGAPRRIPVWVLVPPRTLLLDIAGPIEVLRRANIEQQALRFDAHYVGPREALRTSVGLKVTDIAPLPPALPADALIIVPGTADMIDFADDTEEADAMRDNAAIVEWLRAHVRDRRAHV